jgi:mycothiol synthase
LVATTTAGAIVFFVATLSNLLGFRGERDDAVYVRPLAESDLGVAMALLAGVRPGDPGAHDLRTFAEGRDADLASMRGLFAGDALRWTVLPMPSPGGVLMLLLPTDPLSPAACVSAIDLLRGTAKAYLGSGGRLVQSLVPGDAPTPQSLLLRSGFRRLTELLYLHKPIRRPPPAELPAGFTWVRFDESRHDRFADTIAASYVDSLDCPGLSGTRSMREVMAGHRAAGAFDPDLWFLLHDGTSDVGVILLSVIPESGHLELTYLGVPAASRGRGFGDLMVRHAIATAFARGFDTLTLAVDSGNAPALRLYQRYGLRRSHARTAFVYDERIA